MLKFIRRTILAAALVAVAGPALAGTEILVRQMSPSFNTCVAVQDEMMRNLGADPAALVVDMHTGAVLARRYTSAAADLILVCNRVTETIEVRRVTPGTGTTESASAL